MSQTLSRCANVQLSVNLPKFECTEDIMGNFGNLTDFGRGLGSIPGQLGSIVDCVTDDLRQQIEEAVEPYLKTTRAIMKAINKTVPDPIFDTVEAPEFEFELKIRALWTEFKLVLFDLLISILKKILPLELIERLLNIPIPFLPERKVIDVLSAEGREKIAQSVADRVDGITEELGMPWDLTFTGKLTLKSKDFAAQNILNRIYSEISKILSRGIWNLLNLIPNISEAIKKIWQDLKLPFLPDFFELDFEALFDSIWEGVVEEFDNAVDRMKAMIERILEFNVLNLLKSILGPFWDAIKKLWTFGSTVGEMLKLQEEAPPTEPPNENQEGGAEESTTPPREWNLTLPEINFSRIMQAVKDLFDRIPTMIFELWLQLIKDFLDAIKEILKPIEELLKLIPFTFCSFINLAAKPILSLGSLVRDILPPGITINTVNPPPLLP